MNLRKKKALTARTFGVGLARVEFMEPRLEEIKEAITKQDIRDLYKDGAIRIKNIKGRKANPGKKKKRTIGNVRKKINKRKKEYVTLTRKLRKHLAENREKITDNERKDIRKKIRNKFFRSKSHLKDHVAGKNLIVPNTSHKRRKK
jgi:large subunit ribosomal protein L19e